MLLEKKNKIHPNPHLQRRELKESRLEAAPTEGYILNDTRLKKWIPDKGVRE
jgi:hypothetical protein